MCLNFFPGIGLRNQYFQAAYDVAEAYALNNGEVQGTVRSHVCVRERERDWSGVELTRWNPLDEELAN